MAGSTASYIRESSSSQEGGTWLMASRLMVSEFPQQIRQPLTEKELTLSHSERARRVTAHSRAQPSLQNLRGLEAYARTGSFTNAAADQNVRIASISRRISALERDIGVVLIEQSPEVRTGYILTDAGARLAAFLTSWLAELDEALPDRSVAGPNKSRQGRPRKNAS